MRLGVRACQLHAVIPCHNDDTNVSPCAENLLRNLFEEVKNIEKMTNENASMVDDNTDTTVEKTGPQPMYERATAACQADLCFSPCM